MIEVGIGWIWRMTNISGKSDIFNGYIILKVSVTNKMVNVIFSKKRILYFDQSHLMALLVDDKFCKVSFHN